MEKHNSILLATTSKCFVEKLSVWITQGFPNRAGMLQNLLAQNQACFTFADHVNCSWQLERQKLFHSWRDLTHDCSGKLEESVNVWKWKLSKYSSQEQSMTSLKTSLTVVHQTSHSNQMHGRNDTWSHVQHPEFTKSQKKTSWDIIPFLLWDW